MQFSKRAAACLSLAVVMLAMPSFAQRMSADPTQSAQIKANYGKVPLTFEANQGQTDPRVKFLTKGTGYSVFLTSGGMVLSLRSEDAQAPVAASDPTKLGPPPTPPKPVPTQKNLKSADTTLIFNLVGSNPNPRVVGEEPQPGRANYFIGNDPKKWHTNVQTFARIRYKNVYPGIDLVYYGNHREIEYDLVVAPGADPSKIQFEIKGADKLNVDEQGDLVLTKASSNLHFKNPVVYQESAGVRTRLDGGYAMKDATHVQFNLAPHDSSKALVIDPVLVYSTYLGGRADDNVFGIAVDSTGSAYVSGQTLSSDFPLADPGSLNPYASHIFVTKLDVGGSNIVYSDYVGGNSSDYSAGLVLDSSNNVYIAGSTCSFDFPMVNAFQSNINGCYSGFVTKIAPDGASLIYSTFLGGSGGQWISALALDPSNEVYVGGYTSAQDFPMQSAYQSTVAANENGYWGNYAFLTKFSADGQSLVFSTYLAGNSNVVQDCYYGPCWPSPFSQIVGLAVDPSGNVYAAGNTNTYNFPTTLGVFQAADTTANNQQLGFVSKFTSSGALDYSTYFGGFSGDWLSLTGIAADSSGSAYVIGQAPSDGYFPVTTSSICDPETYGYGCSYGFVTKFSPAGDSLAYSTFLGPYNYSFPAAIVLDASNNAYIAGYSSSSSFALVNGIEAYTNGNDALLVEIDPTGSTELFATFLGANGNEYPAAVALDSNGAIYVAGNTSSTDFPATQAAFQNNLAGNLDTFVMKIGPSSAPAVSVSPFLLQYSIRQVGNQSQPAKALLRNMGSAPLTISSVTISGDFAETDDCGSSVPAAGSCTFTVIFTPTAPGPRYGSILILDDAVGSPQFINLVGDGSTAVVALSPSSLTFPSLPVNTSSSPQSVTLTNNGNATLNISNMQVSTGFTQTNNCPVQLAFGSSCTFQIIFTPTAGGAVTGALTLTDDAPTSPQTVALSGSGYVTTATVTPAGLTYANQNLNSTSAAQTITVTNTGVNVMAVSGVTASGAFAQTNNCTSVAANGGVCTIDVTFTPNAAGSLTGAITINDDAQGNPHVVSLSGTGIAGAANLSATILNFGAQTVGTTSQVQTVTVTNNGNASLVIGAIGASGDFSQTNNCSSVVASGTCSIQVTFVPTSSGSRTGSLTLVDSAVDSPQIVSLTGSGIDFSMSNTSGAATVQAGHTATYTVNIDEVGGSFGGTVNFICSGAPALATCTVNPNSVVPGNLHSCSKANGGVKANGGCGSSDVTVTITTTAPGASLMLPGSTQRPIFAWWSLTPGIFGVLLFGSANRRNRKAWFVLLGILLVATFMLAGCGGSSSTIVHTPAPALGTPAGNYTVIVIGTSGNAQHFTSLALTVQ